MPERVNSFRFPSSIASMALCLFFAGLTISDSWGQASSSMSGRVVDESGAVLPGVTISITHLGTGRTRTVLTDDHGQFRAPALSLGTYEVSAQLDGFRTAIQRGLTVELGRPTVVDLTMQVGEISEEVIVTGGVETVRLTDATMTNLVDSTQIRDLPLNARSFPELATLEGNVSSFRNALSTSSVANSFGGTGIRLVMSGIQPVLSAVVIDGVDALDAFGNAPGSAAGTLLGIDTIREFETLTSNYGAEHGRSAGGIINATTQSGTNEIHGSVFEFHRNDNLDARNFFDRVEKPEFIRNQFGFSAGGPIVKDKTFVFGSYEDFRERLSVTQIARVPSLGARQGTIGDQQIQINPASQQFLDLYPLPNGPDFGDGTAEFSFGASVPTNVEFFFLRGDHIFNESHSLFVRYSFEDADTLFRFSGVPPGRGGRESRQQILGIELSSTLSPRVINLLRFGYNRSNQGEVNFPTEPFRPDLSFLAGSQTGIGALNVGGIDSLGNANSGPEATVQNLFQYSDDVFFTVGSHALKFGGVVKRFQINDDRKFFPQGQFSFDSLSDFLQGIPVSAIIDLPGSNVFSAQRWTTLGLYIQDDWSVTSNFTLNLGLRYEVQSTPFNDDPGEIANFRDPLNDSAASVVGNKPIQNPGKLNFSPRIGLAWDPFGDGKTSIRAGYGLYFKPLDEAELNFTFRLSQPKVQTLLIGGPPARQAFPIITPPPSFRPTFVFPLEHNARMPYTQQWNLTIQREIFENSSFTLAYIGNRGIHIPAPTELNFKQRCPENPFCQPGAPDGFFPPGPPVRENPNFTAINQRDFGSDSYYHSLNARFRHRFQQGFQYQLSYTWSRNIDNGPPVLRDLENSPTILFDFFNRNFDRSLSGFDVRNNFVANFVYELPFGPGKRFGAQSGLAGKIIEGWQVNGIVTIASGNPFTIENAFDRTGTNAIGPFRADRPNLAPGGDLNAQTGNPDAFFDVSNFELQPVGFFGNVGRNTVSGPGFKNVDLSLFKTSSITETVKLQFRAEFFNIFNRANFSTPIRTNRFAFLDAQGTVSGAPGRLTETVNTARQIQFALKLLF